MKALKFNILSIILFGSTVICSAQYNFENSSSLESTEVKNQNRTGTCWSFATSSFIESELIKNGFDDLDLSEMFVVRSIYKDKAMNYVLRQGKANFSEGSLAHDLIDVMAEQGVVPESAYVGSLNEKGYHDHVELSKGLKGFLDGILKSKTLSDRWMDAFESIIDSYLGDYSGEFEYRGKKYDAKSFARHLGLRKDDYVNLTSFTHHPFDEKFILEIPDNYSNGSFYNIPLNKLVENIDHAISKGFTVAWDGDVSEKGFSSENGIAVLPEDAERKDLYNSPGKEISVNQENRQDNFMSYSTTDDHLMHILGIAYDQNRTKYYLIKNSWGEIGPFNGYMYMSENYLKMKTISVTMNKNGLKKDLNFVKN